MKHNIETTVAALQQRGVEDPVEEWPFHPRRKWRFDRAWPDRMIAWEIEGLGRRQTPGRHQRPKGYSGDCEKYTEAALLGWMVLRTTTRQVQSGQALEWLERALGVAAPSPSPSCPAATQ